MKSSPMTVGDVMTQTVVAVGPDAPFKQIVQTMREWKVSALPVLEGDGRVVGVVSEADLLRKEEYRERDPLLIDQHRHLDELAKASGTTARDLMSTPAVSVRSDATLAHAARAMARKRVKRLPVVDAEGRLAGVVSRGDLLKVFLRTDDDIAEEVGRQVVDPLFPNRPATLHPQVADGVVTFTGTLRDTSLVPVVARMTRAVEGVVDVAFDLDNGQVPANAGRPGTDSLY
ncbi:CBS domain-containing protein [Streptomyces durbertensis]|uniref:CBS domain-containing protein n=1 Tax=Streptomyces durbertensis TaxID=2448886 RepID=A0ABR6EJ18_9ACTN|nr:CBS domain-containing protein [Streptomyces durbertensis]MBB1245328.1 CBS domain-containing protein [Streptomyces durbertensis]